MLLDSDKITGDNKLAIMNAINAELINENLITLISKILLANEITKVLNFEITQKLIESDISIENKIDIFSKFIDNMDVENITILLTLLGGSYSKLIEKGKHPTITNNEHNIKLITNLKRVDYISTFKEEGKKLRVNTKVIRKSDEGL
jgi:hypothetical protein